MIQTHNNKHKKTNVAETTIAVDKIKIIILNGIEKQFAIKHPKPQLSQ